MPMHGRAQSLFPASPDIECRDIRGGYEFGYRAASLEVTALRDLRFAWPHEPPPPMWQSVRPLKNLLDELHERHSFGRNVLVKNEAYEALGEAASSFDRFWLTPAHSHYMGLRANQDRATPPIPPVFPTPLAVPWSRLTTTLDEFIRRSLPPEVECWVRLGAVVARLIEIPPDQEIPPQPSVRTALAADLRTRLDATRGHFILGGLKLEIPQPPEEPDKGDSSPVPPEERRDDSVDLQAAIFERVKTLHEALLERFHDPSAIPPYAVATAAPLKDDGPVGPRPTRDQMLHWEACNYAKAHPGASVAALARSLGVSRPMLYGKPWFRDVRDTLKGRHHKRRPRARPRN